MINPLRLRSMQITFFFAAALAPMLAVVAPASRLPGDPCEEIGADCRVMTAAEMQGFKDRMAALRKVLPVPDPARYTQSSLEAFVEGMTAPAKAALSGPGAPPPGMTCRSWPLGCFPESNERQLDFTYSRKEERAKTDKEAKDLLSLAKGIGDEMSNRIEVSAELKPFAHLVGEMNGRCLDVEDESATDIEKSTVFLAYRTGDEESGTVVMIFGPRTCREADVDLTEKPATAFAPVKSIELQITGPAVEIAALKKRVDRKAFEALLGAVVK